jgi:cell wall-associated NlpC family hydrolase
MKTKAILMVVFATLLCSYSSFSQLSQATSPLSAAIDSLKERYAPDRHMAVFDVTCIQQESGAIVRGEVDNPKAKEDVMALVRKTLGGQTIDSLKVLPDPQLGEKKFGIVRVSVGNVRSNPRNQAELSTQALMGTGAKLLKKQGGWCYIQLPDSYMGWLEESAMKVTDAAGHDAWMSASKVIVTSFFCVVREHPSTNSLPVSDAVAGMVFKKIGVSGKWASVELPDGRRAYIEKSSVEDYTTWKKSRKLTGENIEKTAKLFLGVPYLWGGTSPKGVDCSGFTKTVYRLNGMELRRDASEQAREGENVEAGEGFVNLKKGDLLFFGRKGMDERSERITHVGIYLEKKEFIQSSGGGASVTLNSFDPSAANFRGDLLRSFVRARRYIGTQPVPEVPKK